MALVLLTASSGPGAVSLVLLCSTLPQLLGPLAGAVADRVDQRRLLAGCEAGQGVIYGVVAIAHPPIAGLLPLVTAAGLLAALMSPAGKSSVPRLVPADRLPRANAMLGLALNLQIIAGPAIGGALAGLAGPSAAFAVNAASFGVSALLLTRLGPLPPQPADAPGGLMTQTWAGLRYAAHSPILRALVLGTLVFISFAAIDNVALVFLVQRSLHGSGVEYGVTAAAFGVGMVAASLALAAVAGRRPAAHWLIGGVALGAAGTVATGLAPGIAAGVAGPGGGGRWQYRRPAGDRHADPAVRARAPARPGFRRGLHGGHGGVGHRVRGRGPAGQAHRAQGRVPDCRDRDARRPRRVRPRSRPPGPGC